MFSFDISDDRIYFTGNDYNYALLSMNLDGSGIQWLQSTDDVSTIKAAAGKIYYVSDYEDGSLMRCNPDGSDRENLGTRE